MPRVGGLDAAWTGRWSSGTPRISTTRDLSTAMRTVSVGVCAYNEENNIGRSLKSILSQELSNASLLEVIVISSASTDRTDEVVGEFVARDSRVRLLVQPKREGKISAVNLFMSMAKGDILALVNADNNLAPGALGALIALFDDPEVGAAGGRPVPVNSKDTTIGFAVHMLWAMHHRLSLLHPKIGEFIAFRNAGLQIPQGQSSDEDYIRMELERRGYRTAYAPDAVVINKGPETLEDFWEQRVRVNIGEQYLKRRFDYQVPTWNMRFLFPALVGLLQDSRGHLGKAAVAMVLELTARVYASVYVTLDKGDKTVWSMVSSTKKLD